MKTYEADLGKWERGIEVILEAENRHEALQKFRDVLVKDIAEGLLPSDSMVVQMSEDGICIYDYMNGFYDKRSNHD